MSKPLFLSVTHSVVVFISAYVVPQYVAANEHGRPNVVVILADDLGYGDVQCYNPERGKIPTPHIDRLASQGMRFTDAHSSSGVCSPSRYTLLTGRYHWRTRLQTGIVGYLERPLIAPDRLTIAGLAKTARLSHRLHRQVAPGLGLEHCTRRAATVCAGTRRGPPVTERHREAWQKAFSRPIEGGPTTRGFDEYFGTDVPNWPPYCFIEDNRTLGIPTTFLPEELLRDHLASLPGPAIADWKLEGVLPALADRADQVHRTTCQGKPAVLLVPAVDLAPHAAGRQ